MSKPKICAILLVALLSFISPRAEQPVFNYITSNEGLTHNTVFDIAQDEYGFIWIATRSGLNRFDGQNIVKFYADTLDGTLSSNRIQKLLITKNKTLLIGTAQGLCKYNANKKNISLVGNEPIASNLNVVEIKQLSNGKILVAGVVNLFELTKKDTFNILQGGEYRQIAEFGNKIWCAVHDTLIILNSDLSINKKITPSDAVALNLDISKQNIQTMICSKKGDLWVGTMRNGLYRFNEASEKFQKIDLQSKHLREAKFVRTILEDNNGNLWIGTENGVFQHNLESNTTEHYTHSFNPLDRSLNDKAIYRIYQGRDNVIWMGTYFGGVNYIRNTQKQFNNIYADGGKKRLSGKAVSDIISVNNKELWIATEDGNINILNHKNGKITYLNKLAQNASILGTDNIHALEKDNQGNIWIGSFVEGLFKYQLSNNTIYKINIEGNTKSKNISVYDIFKDSSNNLWICTTRGLFYKPYNERNFKTVRPDVFKRHVYDIIEDSQGNYWIGARHSGIYKLNKKFEVQQFASFNTPTIESNKIVYCTTDKYDNIWFGTIEGGMIRYNLNNEQFKSYTMANGLPNNTVYTIIPQGENLWISTNLGLSKFNLFTEKFTNYTQADGLISNQFNFKSACATDGMLFFGSINGLCYFNPYNLSVNYDKPILYITDFKLFNHSVSIGSNSVLKENVNNTSDIYLKYKHNVFSFHFTALNFLSPQNNEFAYYLDGFEKNWNYVGNNNNATYTNLSPGSYTFILKVAGSSGVWSNEKRINIHVAPPFHRSWGGYTLYLVILASLAFLFMRYNNEKHRQKLQVEMARMEKTKLQELNKTRLNFFTYISHEFKTPLTVILATLDHFMTHEKASPMVQKFGNVIKKNAHRLLFLINQLMEFRTIETDHAKIKFNKGDIIAYLKSTFNSFAPLLSNKEIELEFYAERESFITYFDADKIEKILTNLISNSYKCFKDKGAVTLSVGILEANHSELNCESIKISLSDTGPGLSKEELKRIFEPFYSQSPVKNISSGIGLTLVYSLVRFLKGKISVDSTPGEGTNFDILLPVLQYINTTDTELGTYITENLTIEPELSIIDEEDTFEELTPGKAPHENDKRKLLIVEDNKELSGFLKFHFSNKFDVSIANNGREALQAIEMEEPDFIVSDIMMPEMDGIEFCKHIKSDIKTSHILLILLTAKTTVDSKIEGLDVGADAYLNKPFNLKELELIIRNKLKTRADFQSQFQQSGTVSKKNGSLNKQDKDFIEKLTSIIHKNMDNSEFDVTHFVNEANVSRTLLHVKLKKLTGLSTTEFIKTIRLTEAKKLLINDGLTVAETAYKVGFNDPTYFSRSFKKLFNMSPSEIKNV